jgi:hypothetical protein
MFNEISYLYIILNLNNSIIQKVKLNNFKNKRGEIS